MQTIVINSQKGGSGKSTLCRILSVSAAQSQLGGPVPVYLIDLDPQRTLAQWHEVREADDPRRVEFPVNGLSQGLAALAKAGADYVFIDTPPQASEHLDDVFALADMVIVPMNPTPDDLKSAAVTVNRLKSLGVPFLFVITRAIQNSNITAQAIAALSHHGPVAETMIVNRVIYPAAFTDGRTPLEIDPKGCAGRETLKLWGNMQSFLNASMQTIRSAANG